MSWNFPLIFIWLSYFLAVVCRPFSVFRRFFIVQRKLVLHIFFKQEALRSEFSVVCVHFVCLLNYNVTKIDYVMFRQFQQWHGELNLALRYFWMTSDPSLLVQTHSFSLISNVWSWCRFPIFNGSCITLFANMCLWVWHCKSTVNLFRSLFVSLYLIV